MTGDVIYAGQHKAKVLQVMNSGDVLIEFDDATLIPRQMKVPSTLLVAIGEPTLRVDLDTQCPRCLVPWTVSEGVMRFYRDCPKCGAKREDFAP